MLWDIEPHFNLLYHLSSRLLSSPWHCPSCLPPQVPTSHTKPKEQTMQRTQIQQSSTQRVVTPTRTKRKSTTSNQNRTPHSSVLFWTLGCFWGWGMGREGGAFDEGISDGSWSLLVRVEGLRSRGEMGF